MSVKSHFVQVGGVNIHVEEQGEGPTVVLLHGFTGSATTMADIGGRLGRRRQLRVDLIGHGRSAVPDDVNEYSMKSTVSHVAAVIEGLWADPVDLLGYSLGGRVALSLLVARPELVRKATLIGATPGLRSRAERTERQAADERLAHMIDTDGIEVFVDHWMALPMWETLEEAISTAQWAASRMQRLSSNPAGLANSLRGAGTGAMPALFNDLAAVTTPTQLVVGELDTKFLAIAATMAGLISTSEVSVVAGVGHAIHVEAPAATAEVVVKFLE